MGQEALKALAAGPGRGRAGWGGQGKEWCLTEVGTPLPFSMLSSVVLALLWIWSGRKWALSQLTLLRPCSSLWDKEEEIAVPGGSFSMGGEAGHLQGGEVNEK